MNYQDKILKRYREYFPKKTLKVISKETGIHMTRIFRLFNGSEMKMSEYEAFEKTIIQRTLSSGQINLMIKIEDFLLKTNAKDAEFLQIEIEQQLKKIEFKSTRFAYLHEKSSVSN